MHNLLAFISKSIFRNNDSCTVFYDERIGVSQLLTEYPDFRSGFAGIQDQRNACLCNPLQCRPRLLPTIAFMVEQGSIKIGKYEQARFGHGKPLYDWVRK